MADDKKIHKAIQAALVPPEASEYIKQLQAANELLKEHIVAALDDLPESPNKAMNFLTHALKGDE